MLVSAEPNLHSPLLGCYKIALHFDLAETQYPMRRIDQSRGDKDILCSDEEVCLASKHNPFDAENGGGRLYCKYSLFTIYGLAVTVSSKEWCSGAYAPVVPGEYGITLRLVSMWVAPKVL
jgi:hypothetical protein